MQSPSAGCSANALAIHGVQHERLVEPAGGRNVTGEYDPRLHSEGGQVFVSLPSVGPTDFDQRCLNATTSQPEFPFLLDMNNGRANGLCEPTYLSFHARPPKFRILFASLAAVDYR